MGDNHGLKWPDGLREFDGVSDARRRHGLRSPADHPAERQLVRFSGSGFVRICAPPLGTPPSRNRAHCRREATS